MTQVFGLVIRLLGGLALAGFFVAAFSSAPSGLGRLTLTTASVGPADAIVVLGSSVSSDGTLDPYSLQRTVRGIMLFKRGLAPLIVFSGGRLPNGVSEAEVRASMAREFGLPAGAILTESEIQTTRDEARRIHALLEPRGVRRILLVSETLHLTRAQPLFEREGFRVLAAPSDGGSDWPTRPEQRLHMTNVVLSELLARLYARAL